MYIFGGILHNSTGKTLMEIMFTYNLLWYFLFTICPVYMIKSQMTRKSFRHWLWIFKDIFMKDCLKHDASTKAYKFLKVNYLSQHDKRHCQEKWIFSNIFSWNESNTLIVLNQWIHYLHIKTDLLWHNWNFGWSEFVICSRCFAVSEMVSSVSKTCNLITLSLSLPP